MLKNKSIFVCFVGIDGSGKSTLAKYLVDTMVENGHDYKYVHGLIRPFLLKPAMMLSRFLFLRGKNKFEDYMDYSNTKTSALKRNYWASYLYYYLLILDYLPQIFFKIKVPLLLGKSICCDRYIYDTLINLAVNIGYSDAKTAEIIQSNLRFFPKPDLLFLVDVPEEIAFHRKGDVPSIHYLRERRAMYRGIQERFNMTVLDGSKDLAKLKQTIRDRLMEYLEAIQ